MDIGSKEEREIKISPRFLSWAAFWLTLILSEKINREEAVLEVAKDMKTN